MTKLRLFVMCMALVLTSTAAFAADRVEDLSPRSDLPPPASDHTNPLERMREKFPDAVAELEKIIESGVLERNGGDAAVSVTGELEVRVLEASDVTRVKGVSDRAIIAVDGTVEYQDGTRNQDTDFPDGHFGGASITTLTPGVTVNCTAGVPLRHAPSGYMAMTTAGHCLFGIFGASGDYSGLEWWYSGNTYYGAGAQNDYKANGDIGRITSGVETYSAEVWHGSATTSTSFPVVGWTFVNEAFDDICVSTRVGSLCGWEVRNGYTWRCNPIFMLSGCAWTVQLNEPDDGWTHGGDSGSTYYRLVSISTPPYVGIEIVGLHLARLNNFPDFWNPRYIFGTTPDVINSRWPGWSVATFGDPNTSW